MKLARLADVVTVLVGLAVLGVLVARIAGPPLQSSSSPLGVKIGTDAGIDFAVAERTLVMVLQSDCRYCEQSVPFYRSLPRQPRGVQVVIVAPPGDVEIDAYREIVQPDAVLFVEPTILPVTGTPTLLLVDQEGNVEASWRGLLDVTREEDVRRTVFD